MKLSRSSTRTAGTNIRGCRDDQPAQDGANAPAARRRLSNKEQRVLELRLRSNAIEAELMPALMAALERWEELGTRLSAAR